MSAFIAKSPNNPLKKEALQIMRLREIIHQKITEALAPDTLEIVDESAAHKDHHHGMGDETHFHVQISAKCLDGLTRIQQHRRVYEALEQELKTDVHSVRVTVYNAVMATS